MTRTARRSARSRSVPGVGRQRRTRPTAHPAPSARSRTGAEYSSVSARLDSRALSHVLKDDRDQRRVPRHRGGRCRRFLGRACTARPRASSSPSHGGGEGGSQADRRGLERRGPTPRLPTSGRRCDTVDVPIRACARRGRGNRYHGAVRHPVQHRRSSGFRAACRSHTRSRMRTININRRGAFYLSTRRECHMWSGNEAAS